MGTLQFPDLGKHCSVDDCRQLDFLPFTCDRCHLVFCLEHRSYIDHKCPKSDYQGVTVTIGPLCAKGVRLVPNQHPNITWDSHLNIECDPSNYDRVTKKKRCPVPRCRETLTFSNTINCKDCAQDHCLKHRFVKRAAYIGSGSTTKISNLLVGFGLDHNCPGPKKQDTGFSFMANFSRKQDPKPDWAILSQKSAVDVCPMCSRGFRDAVALVEHVERDHRGVSKV